MPRFGTKSLLIGVAVVALWLVSFTDTDSSGLGIDIRRAIWLLIVLSSGLLALFHTGRRRAFWIGFFAALFVLILSQQAIFVPQFNWVAVMLHRYGPINQPIEYMIRLAIIGICRVALATVAGVIAVYIYDRCTPVTNPKGYAPSGSKR